MKPMIPRSAALPHDDREFWPDDAIEWLPAPLDHEAKAAEAHIRSGRFQRSLSLLAALSSVLTGLEVAYEHYRAGFGQRIQYTPVVLSGAMTVAGLCGARSPRAARTLLRWTSVITLLDGVVGFGFHVRGVARKPGGWRLPVTNIVTGPPIFAPLLFGTSAYLGLVASFLRPEQAPARPTLRLSDERPRLRHPESHAGAPPEWTLELREGRFQKHLAAAAAAATVFSGFEALYSHYKGNFRKRAQWAPVVITPLLATAAAGAVASPRVARTLLPATSALAIAGGAVGFFYHTRGVLRRPGGIKKPVYNVIYGPPVFAPLLFAACGFIGLLASLMRRER